MSSALLIADEAPGDDQRIGVNFDAPGADDVVIMAAPAMAGIVFGDADDVFQGPDAIKQVEALLRPLLNSELYFAQVVCRPTPEQERALRAADSCLEDAAQYVVVNHTLIRDILTMLGRPSRVEPRIRIRQGIARAVRETLSAEQAAKFGEEFERRNASRQSAMIRMCVLRLDEVLFLSTEQRDQLLERLSAHWEESWEATFRAWQDTAGYFPDIPDELVAPLLDLDQKGAWSTLQKFSGTWFDFDVEQQIWEVDPDAVEDPETAKDVAEAGPRARNEAAP